MIFVYIIAGILLAAVISTALLWAINKLRYRPIILADEIHTIKTDDLWQIKLFRHMPYNTDGDFIVGEPILLCPGAFSSHYNFNLPEGESIVDSLTAAGYDCWIVEYRGNRSAHPPRGHLKHEAVLDDYLLQDVPASIEHICRYTGYPKVHWIGHSMGGMLLYAYAQVFGTHRVASGITLGAPIGFDGARVSTGTLKMFLLRVSPAIFFEVIRSFSPLLTYIEPRMSPFPVHWGNLHPKIGAWAFYHLLDTMSYQAAKTLRDWAVHQEWHMRTPDGTVVDIKAGLPTMEFPLLAFYGARDPFIPLSHARAFFKKLSTQDKQLIVLSRSTGYFADYNHVDLAFARHGVAEVHTPMVEWLRAHPVPERHTPDEQLVRKAEILTKRVLPTGSVVAKLPVEPMNPGEPIAPRVQGFPLRNSERKPSKTPATVDLPEDAPAANPGGETSQRAVPHPVNASSPKSSGTSPAKMPSAQSPRRPGRKKRKAGKKARQRKK